MLLRKLSADPREIYLGNAMRIITNVLTLLETSTKKRMEFFDEELKEFFSLEGTEKEVELLNTLYNLSGPSISYKLYEKCPVEYTALIERRRNRTSKKQGIMYALQIHDIHLSNKTEKSFLRTLRKLKTI